MKTNLQIIKNAHGKPEYVLLPFHIYDTLKNRIEKEILSIDKNPDYFDFKPEDFIKNPIALARMKAKITQTELAKKLKTSQAYISKIENDDCTVSEKLFNKIKAALNANN
jgi:DNA-binding XRE family transcriptional regulator